MEQELTAALLQKLKTVKNYEDYLQAFSRLQSPENENKTEDDMITVMAGLVIEDQLRKENKISQDSSHFLLKCYQSGIMCKVIFKITV